MKSRFYLLMIAVSAILLAGCGGKETEGVSIPKPGSSAVIADADALRLAELEADPNRIVSNNAKQAREALKNGDCYKAMVALTTIRSAVFNEEQLEIVDAAIREVVKVSEARIKEGDENAQFAMDFLQSLINPQAQ